MAVEEQYFSLGIDCSISAHSDISFRFAFLSRNLMFSKHRIAKRAVTLFVNARQGYYICRLESGIYIKLFLKLLVELVHDPSKSVARPASQDQLVVF